MMNIFKDNVILLFVSLSVVLLGSIIVSINTPVPNEKEIAEKILSTEIYTTDVFDHTSIVNRVEQIEIDIKLLKLALESEKITDLVEENPEGGSIINWPAKFRFELKAPSSQ